MLQLGQDTKVQALGREYTVSRLELRIVRAFKDYVAGIIGDPFAQVNDRYFDLLCREEQLAVLKQAKQDRDDLACFSLHCPLAKRFLEREEGIAVLGRLMLRKHHPDITEDEAFNVWLALGQEQLNAAMASAAGEPVGNGGAAATA
jgi:hypothetical protein